MNYTVVKIGGNVIDDGVALSAFLEDFSRIDGAKILVHGGGKIATKIGTQLGIESRYADGRRITDAQTLDLVTMVYGGLVNKKIVALFQSKGCNAIGLTGADANVLLAEKRKVSSIDYGFVGDITAAGVNVTVVKKLMEAGLTIVLAPLTHDGNGSLLNTNADTIAQEVAKALATAGEVNLIYCFEKDGVLRDVTDDGSVIARLDRPGFEKLKEDGIVTDGMLPKLTNAFTALDAGVKSIHIGCAAHLSQLLKGTKGTKLT